MNTVNILGQAIRRAGQKVTPRVALFLLRHLAVASTVPEIRAKKLVSRLLSIDLILMLVFVTAGSLISVDEMGWAFREGKPMTLISIFQLLGASFFCRQIWKQLQPAGKAASDDQYSLWRYLSWIFVFLACDDFLRIHETLDRVTHRLLGIKPNNITDHMDDALIVVYGMVALLVLAWHWRESLRLLEGWRYFCAAVLCACGTVLFDFLSGGKPFLRPYIPDYEQLKLVINVLDVVEEIFKTLAEVFFLGAFVRVFEKVIPDHRLTRASS